MEINIRYNDIKEKKKLVKTLEEKVFKDIFKSELHYYSPAISDKFSLNYAIISLCNLLAQKFGKKDKVDDLVYAMSAFSNMIDTEFARRCFKLESSYFLNTCVSIDKIKLYTEQDIDYVEKEDKDDEDFLYMNPTSTFIMSVFDNFNESKTLKDLSKNKVGFRYDLDDNSFTSYNLGNLDNFHKIFFKLVTYALFFNGDSSIITANVNNKNCRECKMFYLKPKNELFYNSLFERIIQDAINFCRSTTNMFFPIANENNYFNLPINGVYDEEIIARVYKIVLNSIFATKKYKRFKKNFLDKAEDIEYNE